MEEHWRKFLEQPDTLMTRGRHVFLRLPSEPRCRLCAAPFAGGGGALMRLIGKEPSAANPHVCTSCEKGLKKHHGGAEVSAAMLFADIRGSTALAERMSPSEFHALLDRFYTVASRVVFAHDGVVDKFVGDELVALYYPGMGGHDYVSRAILSAQALLRETGHAGETTPWAPVGAGVHTGRVWFGASGEGDYVELTAVGDPVNVTARLAAAARAGEVLVSVTAAEAARLDPTLERRTLELKGKTEPVAVVALGAAA
jgi:adenylate cyclase